MMANSRHNRTNENMTLSQSYSQGVERIRKQMHKIGPLELPKEILFQREHAWDKLFEKYMDNVSNDIEVNIHDSDSESKSKVIEFIDGDKDDVKDDNEYFSKCRTPMRKHPALIQYWVDTGNPPYQLIDDNSSMTGSSLSEAENSRPKLLIANKRSNVENKQSNSTSLYSSVDTIAYILSNTNVTKKSVSTAITKSVKNLNTSPVNVTKAHILSKNSPTDSVTKNKTIDDCNNSDKLKNVLHKCEIVHLTTNTLTKNANTNWNDSSSRVEKSIDENKDNDKKLDSPILAPIMHNSMKITDILPTLVQFDEILRPENIQGDQQDKILSDDASLFGGTPKTFKQPRSFNRKKLYTERNSPIDVIVSVLENRKRLSRSSFHPALCTPSIKRNTLFSRRRTSLFQKHRKKRFSQLADALKNIEKTMNDRRDDEANQHDCDEKLSETLKWTQSDSKMCRRTRKIPAIAQISPKMDVNRKCTSNNLSYDIDILKTTTKPCANYSRKEQNEEKLKNLVALCSQKNLQIRLERYEEKNPSPKDTRHECMTNEQLTDSLSPSNNISPHKVHELEVESQESDQSTILIYKCANDQVNNTSSMKSHNESNREIVKEIKELHRVKRRKRNKSNRRKTSKNVGVSSENQRNTHKINRNSVTTHSKLIFASDEDSPTKMSSKFFHGSPTHFQNFVIKFSSDEEDDFLRIIRKNSREHIEKRNNVIPTSIQFRPNTGNNCENFIENLACQFTEKRKIPTASATAMNLTIINSDDEENSNAQKFVTNTKKTVNRRVGSSNESLVRTRSMSYSSDGHHMDTNGNAVENITAKGHRHNSPSCTATINAKISLPTKKLKLAGETEVKWRRNTAIKKSRKTSGESIDKNLILCDTALQLNNNVSTRSGDEIETNKVPSTNQTNGVLSKTIAPRTSEISPSSAKESDTSCRAAIVYLEKLRSFSRFPPSLTSNICRGSIDTNEKMKLRTKNLLKLKRNTIEIETGISDSSRSAKFNYCKLNGTSSDKNKLIHGSENTMKLLSNENTGKNNIHKSFHTKTFPTIFDDSSSEGSLEFQYHGRSRCVKMKKLLKNQIVTFRTKSDDSESDRSIHLQEHNSTINNNES